MEDISIKITIANRSYPVTVKPENEEMMRKAAKLINDRIKVYEANYSVKDMQDLLAMCTLEFTNKFLEADNRKHVADESIAVHLEEMEQFLSNYLSQY